MLYFVRTYEFIVLTELGNALHSLKKMCKSPISKETKKQA